MPSNVGGVHINPAEWNRNDGFSPGSSGLLFVPGIDLAQTGAAPITDIEQSLEPDAPVVMIDVDTGQRVPNWVELDLQASGPSDVTLMVRPAVQLLEGHRHVVALRDLRDANGDVIEPDRGFEIYRDQIPTFAPEVEDRRPQMESIFAALDAHGVPTTISTSPGTSPSPAAQPHRAAAAHPRRPRSARWAMTRRPST